ncbi:hypothetical protein C8A03DRAFT_41770 [Achaetomium macrosporum]|uniref:Ubiquitin carboxyl-terminal hydrolase n=1 Tax=Achaetomium macrosporum TaxID=79813 RepID=A0AAN7HEC7_9PEZI|nr:hypothetical protein C8A03DRAFT_41770 [Achaetomium macrosporum]
MAEEQKPANPSGETGSGGGEANPPVTLRRSGRVRRRPSNHSDNCAQENRVPVASSASTGARRNPKRKAAPETFDVSDNLLEASLAPWKQNELTEWGGWTDLESDPAFFTLILGLLGVKGARIVEALSVDEHSLAALPSPVYGLVFLYQYLGEESGEETAETGRDVWFANQTTNNACATIALLNIIMNVEGLSLGEKLRKFKAESIDLSPPLRGNMITNSAWIRRAHNSFARQVMMPSPQDSFDANNQVDKSLAAKKSNKRLKRRRTGGAESEGGSGYHFIAFVPRGRRVWLLDGLSSAPVCMGEYAQDQHWTSVMRPVLQERMMRYETEQLSFSLLALCGDDLAHVRQKLATNIRCFENLAAKYGNSPEWKPKTSPDIIYSSTDARLSLYQLDAEDIKAAVPDTESELPNPQEPSGTDREIVETALKLWEKLSGEQKGLRSQYEGSLNVDGRESARVFGRTKDHTPAIHEWVKTLANLGTTTTTQEPFDRRSKRSRTTKDMSKRSYAAVAANGAASKEGSQVTMPSMDKQRLLLSTDAGHFSLIRALHMADLITELNGLCGVLSLFASMRYCLGDATQHGNLWAALLFLPFGLFFDFLDGKVARWRKKSSMMGQELDSLADLISFGVAPAAVAFAIGIRTPLDHLCLAFFVLCGLTRLARFNVTATSIPKDASGKAKYFEGTPIPTTLALDALMGWWVSNGWIHESLPGGVWFAGSVLEVHPVVVLFMVHGCLMTSRTIHIPKP